LSSSLADRPICREEDLQSVTRGRIDRQIDMARLDRRLLFAIDDLVAAFRFALDRNPRRKNVNELTRNCE
jgi:hypothetical protein